MKRVRVYLASAAATIGILGSVAAFKPRPSALTVTPRVGDDTVVVNQSHGTRLKATVLDQYGRVLRADTVVHYERIGGDSAVVSSNGLVGCDSRRDVVVRAEFATLSKQFLVRCRPVKWVEAPSWVDLVVDDSTHDLALVAHGPDGRPVTELRGTLRVENSAIVGLEGTRLRAKRPGFTSVDVEVGDAKMSVPLVVYEPVTSFVTQPRKEMTAMRVKLARGDTLMVPVPKAAFWVTYFSRNRGAAPPTIELVGDGLCTLGNGVRARRIEEDEYAKYCTAGDGVQMRIAHGAVGADTVSGVVAVRLMWTPTSR